MSKELGEVTKIELESLEMALRRAGSPEVFSANLQKLEHDLYIGKKARAIGSLCVVDATNTAERIAGLTELVAAYPDNFLAVLFGNNIDARNIAATAVIKGSVLLGATLVEDGASIIASSIKSASIGEDLWVDRCDIEDCLVAGEDWPDKRLTSVRLRGF